MTLRITDPADASWLSRGVRRQLEQEFEAVPLTPAARRRRYLEEAAGRQLVQWIDTLVIDHGKLGRVRVAEYFAHVPNGGARSETEAAILKGQGVRAGWPDYVLDIPRGPWHGARGELKSVDGDKPDDNQLDILTRLHRMGYRSMVWFGFDDAQKQILGYLQLGPAAR